MKWFEFQCKNCKRILNRRKYEVYTNRREKEFCRECASSECVDCGLHMFTNPNDIAKCKSCRVAENKKIRKAFPSVNCVYLLYSKKREMFKIGETKSIATRLSRIKYECFPSADWKIIDVFPYVDKKLLEKVLHSRFSNFKIDDESIDYFRELHFMLKPEKFIKECESCVDFLTPSKGPNEVYRKY